MDDDTDHPPQRLSRRALLAGTVGAVVGLGGVGVAAATGALGGAAGGPAGSAADPTKPPAGYPSVAAMLASRPFYVAHRGGSLDWPEMSGYAYRQSVAWGVGALEVSLGRTSDGVWVGVHDETLDRTSGTHDFVVAEHTWAEVSALRITAAATNHPGQPARPYLRWEELVDAFYETHVLFIDPKAAASHAGELLAMMDALPGSPTDRVVAKFYGVSTAWAQQARGHGYTTWGYFYQADVPQLPAFQSRWDLLGMDHRADDAAWAAVTSYGRPVIGHVCPDASAVASALARGAAGVVVSGVVEGVPKHSRV